jgi:hypothetical protein
MYALFVLTNTSTKSFSRDILQKSGSQLAQSASSEREDVVMSNLENAAFEFSDDGTRNAAALASRIGGAETLAGCCVSRIYRTPHEIAYSLFISLSSHNVQQVSLHFIHLTYAVLGYVVFLDLWSCVLRSSITSFFCTPDFPGMLPCVV